MSLEFLEVALTQVVLIHPSCGVRLKDFTGRGGGFEACIRFSVQSELRDGTLAWKEQRGTMPNATTHEEPTTVGRREWLHFEPDLSPFFLQQCEACPCPRMYFHYLQHWPAGLGT